jgi:2-isopropylmalate synthase
MDASGKEFTAHDIHDIFQREYGVHGADAPHYSVAQTQDGGQARTEVRAELMLQGGATEVHGTGNGPIDAFVAGVAQATGQAIRVLDYHEHAVGAGSGAQAVAYLELRVGERTLFGVGADANIVSASLKAIVSGLQRAGVVGRSAGGSGGGETVGAGRNARG